LIKKHKCLGWKENVSGDFISLVIRLELVSLSTRLGKKQFKKILVEKYIRVDRYKSN